MRRHREYEERYSHKYRDRDGSYRKESQKDYHGWVSSHEQTEVQDSQFNMDHVHRGKHGHKVNLTMLIHYFFV